jgi:hypothetical protein
LAHEAAKIGEKMTIGGCRKEILNKKDGGQSVYKLKTPPDAIGKG